jgi:transcription initiation factor TFIIIB Brf1 subunit/transcription initiation factor TFIIB
MMDAITGCQCDAMLPPLSAFELVPCICTRMRLDRGVTNRARMLLSKCLAQNDAEDGKFRPISLAAGCVALVTPKTVLKQTIAKTAGISNVTITKCINYLCSKSHLDA